MCPEACSPLLSGLHPHKCLFAPVLSNVYIAGRRIRGPFNKQMHMTSFGFRLQVEMMAIKVLVFKPNA